MEQLHKQVARARRRLVTEQFLGRLVWCLFAALLVSAVGIAVPKVLVVQNLPPVWNAGWLIGGVAVGFLSAVVWTVFSHRSPIEAAIEIDQRFGLRERVASSLSLTDQDRQTEVGQAVINDAARAVGRIEVGGKFRIQLHRQAWLPLVPAVLAFCLAAFVNNRQAESKTDPRTAQQIAKQVNQSAEALRKKIAKQRRELEKRGLKDAEGIFKEIEKSTEALSEKKDIDRTKAVVKLNELGKQLQKRRQQIGGKEAMQRQFNNLKDLNKGPADKVVQAMKQGDWSKAIEQVKDLQSKLADGKLDKQQKQQLQKQLQQMQEKLAAMANAHQQAMDDLKKQIEQQRRKGNLDQAAKLQQKLDQLAAQKPQMDRLQKMAQQLDMAQQAIQQGNAQQAAQAMDQMAQQLGQMQQDMKELEALDAAMDQLEFAKNAMGCQQCQGQGCAACQGGEFGMMGLNDQMGMNMGMGMGMGRGPGTGPRPDDENPTNLRDTRVRQKIGRGAAVFGGFTEGGNVKGTVQEQIKEEMASLGDQPADPLTAERLPRSRQEHAREYFRAIGEGL